MADIDFLAIFRTEVEGQLLRANDLALDLERLSSNEEPVGEIIASLMREFHTIKGAASAIKFDEVKDVAHLIEDVYHSLMQGKGEVRMPDLTSLTLYALDVLATMLQGRVDGVISNATHDLAGLVKAYLSGEKVNLPGVGTNNLIPPSLAPELGVESGEAIGNAEPVQVAKASVPPSSAVKYQAGDYKQLSDSLLNISGEFTVAINTLQDQRQMLRNVSQNLEAYERDIGLFMAQTAETIISLSKEPPLERISDLKRKFRAVTSIYRKSVETLDLAESRLQFLGENLRDNVTRSRLVSLSNLFGSYPRVVRDLSQELGKSCGIEVSGEHTRIDRAILEGVRVPLIHLLRNSLDHGLETPEERKAAGKQPQGLVLLNAVQLGGQIKITLEDDGRGVNYDKIGAKVIERGVTTAELWETMKAEEKQQFLFLPGFSTTNKVSETSGRGFGLDIVKTEVEKVGGRVTLEQPESGIGMRVVLVLPLTLSLTRCLMVEGGKSQFFGRHIYGFPLNEVGQVRRFDLSELRTIEGKRWVRIEDITLPLDDFAQLMGISTTSAKQEDMFLIIMGTGNQRRALLVDGVQGEQDIVIRALDSRMVKLCNIQGGAMLRDGGIALVVDTSDLMQSMKDSADSSYSSYDEQGSLISEQDEGRASAHILVVEDSATVREVERHMLEQAGYRVTTAVNGVDGFNKLRNDLFDVIVSDIDMPRMNGIEMITKIRGLEKYLKIPIIVVSYKDREQDRMQAFEAGANHYVTKSAFDLGEMMQQIKAFIGANWTET